MGQPLSIEALGATIAIDLGGASAPLSDAVCDAWQDAIAASPGEIAATVEVEDAQVEHVLESLSQRVTLAAIEARRGEMWMLHAAGLALSDGRVVALVGPSGRGKTTAARTLAQSLGYVTDETVAIDERGRVWPYRKPLSIIESPVAPKVQRAPSTVGLQPLPDVSLRLAAIILLDRRDDAPDEPYVERVELRDALEDLVAQSSYLTHMSEPLRQIARHAAAVGGVLRVVYREVASIAPLIGALAVEPSTARDQPVLPAPMVRRLELPESKVAYFRTGLLDDVALEDGDDIAVLTVDDGGAGTVRVLSGIGPAIYAAASGSSFEELVAHVVAMHGTPPDTDPAVLVRAALYELQEAGVVTLREGQWAVRDDVAWTDGDRHVVLSLSSAQLQPQALEGPAAIIWGAVAAGPAVEARIIEQVATAAGLSAATVSGDVAGFLRTLHGQHLLELR